MTASDFGRLPPSIRTHPPGPGSRALAERLRRVESRNVTYLADDFPVFWEAARGANVRDVDGNVYVDFTAAFGVALVGHGRPEIAAAVGEQMERLVHGMGDVHPPALKVELLERLGRILPWPDARTVLATGGAEAVEVALKTALLATGKPGIVSFRGGYHGLTGSALAVTARPDFREPFGARVYDGTVFLPFPVAGAAGEAGGEVSESVGGASGSGDAAILDRLEAALAAGAPNGDLIGAVVVEPIQARGGVRIPPDGFLRELGERARAAGALVVADEIFTGLGRTGALWASAAAGLEPDLLCIGKALGGGFPLYACSGPAVVMAAWPESLGEAIHTSTFLGHPASCAAGVAFLDLLEDEDVPERALELGASIRSALEEELDGVPGVTDIRGRGLMQGVELGGSEDGLATRVAVSALREGILVLPAGDRGEVVELTPPTVLTADQLRGGIRALGRAIRGVCGALAVVSVLLFGWLGPGIGGATPVAAQQEAGEPVPVLLIPGWGDGPAELGHLRTRFIEGGWPPGHVVSLAFRDPVGSNREHADEVAAAVRELLRSTGAPAVDIVAHSMGGLALREYLRWSEADMSVQTSSVNAAVFPAIRRIVFLATPHRGTVAAFIARGAGGDEMRPGSPFLATLNADTIPPPSIEFLSIRTPVDLSVVPNESAVFFPAENVRNVEVCCPSHNGLLDDRRTFREAVEFLRE